MKSCIYKPLLVLALTIALCFLCMGIASLIQSDFGNISIEQGYIESDPGHVRIAYKLYRPGNARTDNPVPAVLAMHGYQSDKDTSAAFSIELARRGIVVLSIDLYGHGDTIPGMRERGAGTYRVTDLNTPIAGPDRAKVLLSFSVLDFFRPDIATGVKDSSMGGKIAWRYLADLPFVDQNRMGLTGHSMGTWAAWSVAAAFPEHRAIVHQAGEVFPLDFYDSENIRFNNVMLLQAVIEEFDNMRDYQPIVRGLEQTPLRYRDFMGQDAPVEWNRTYGSFDDGSARRMELIPNNHRLVTFDKRGLTATMDWFTTALDAGTPLAVSNHTYRIKETLQLIAMLAALISMLPLFLLLKQVPFFAPLGLPLAETPKMLSPKNRRIAVITGIVISGLTFPFLTQLGHGLLPVPENIFRMTIGTGFITWLTFLMLVSLVMLLVWMKKGGGKSDGWTLGDIGLACRPQTTAFKKRCIITRAIIMACILTGMMYFILYICTRLFNLDFRFIWPFFRPFTPVRFGQFLIYLPFYTAFFTINAGVRLYGQLRLPEISRNGTTCAALTQLTWWGYSILVMLGGVFLIAFIQYIPFLMGIGPGADLLFTPLFGGPFMSFMILLIPQFAVFFFMSTWLFRKSGTVYTGSFVVSILAAWVLCGGSAVF